MDDVAEAYRAVSDRYIELFGHIGAVHTADVAMIDRHLAAGAGTVLDLGCGPGHLTAHLAAAGRSAVGIDVVAEFLETARPESSADRILGSFRQLPLRDASADGILAWYSLVHLTPGDVDAVLAEFRRVAITGSSLVVGFFDGIEVAALDHRVATAFTWPVDELVTRLRHAGFDTTERTQRPADPHTGARPHAAIAAVAR